jgi:hypothetical protein
MKDHALGSCYAIDERIITDGDAEIRNAVSTVLKSVAAQPQASTVAPFYAIVIGTGSVGSGDVIRGVRLRRGCWASGGRLRAGFAGLAGRAPRLYDAFLPRPARSPPGRANPPKALRPPPISWKLSPAFGVLADRRRRAVGVIGAGQIWQVASERVDGIGAAWGKLARDARHDRLARRAVSASLSPQPNRCARR